jgi:hypothetical protein
MPRPLASEGAGSMGRIFRRSTAETRYETASASKAIGAVSVCTRMPPALGPATKDVARLALRSVLASR